MREQLIKMIHATPFEPFMFDLAEDVVYAIPTPDHIMPGKEVAAVMDDEGYIEFVSYHNIRRIRHKVAA